MAMLRRSALIFGMVFLLAFVFGIGVLSAPVMYGRVIGADQPFVPALASADPPPEVEEQFEIFWEAWDVVDEHFVDRQAIDAQKRIYGAIGGMLDSLGDMGHTRFLSPEEVKEEREGLAGRFEGIGAEISQRDGRPVIVTPLDGSPAERAGVQPGDVIVAVEGQDTNQMTLREVIRRIRGPKGTTVTISVLHPQQTTVTDLSITRDEIKVESVVWHYLPESGIGHVRITQFNSNVNAELLDALRALRAQGAKALVLDVRNNPGGLLDQAVAVTSQFLSNGNVLLEQDAKGNRRPYPVRPGGAATDLPVVVLINRGTASAGEIFAGAIKDHQRGPLVGERTFGTGTVLTSFPLSDGSALLLAIAEWLTPEGQRIKNEGITPDVAVSLAEGQRPLTARAAGQMSEQEILAADAQLRAAVEALKAGVR